VTRASRLHLRIRNRGMGLVEVMVAITIAGAVLTAMAIAVHASFQAYTVNVSATDLLQRNRVAINRLVTDIRRGTDHTLEQTDPDAHTLFRSGGNNEGIVTANSIEVRGNADSSDQTSWPRVSYIYDAGTKVVKVVSQKDATADKVTFNLLKNVTQFQITLEPTKGKLGLVRNEYDKLKRAVILITIQDPTTKQTSSLSTSVIPRRNIL
jgi:prepilin-type N-terminal cleavage/methylation domain-containing protein